ALAADRRLAHQPARAAADRPAVRLTGGAAGHRVGLAQGTGGRDGIALPRCAVRVPGGLLAILPIAMFGAGPPAPPSAPRLAHLPYIARVPRAAALRERELPYVDALRVHGFSGFQICWRHLLPNLAPLIIAQATVSFGYVMVDLAAISFLGLGVQPPSADWGVMVASGEPAILAGHPQQSLYAGILIVITVCAFTILGERLADPDRAPGR